MNSYTAIERELGRRTYFPNAGEVAHFDPQSQTIHLTRMTAEGFNAALAANDKPTLRHSFGTMIHELTHWADLIGTLWGREYLSAVYAVLKLIPTISSSGAEYEFYRFIELHDRTRRLMLSRYFRTVNTHAAHHDQHRPWRLDLSAGREFDPTGRLNEGRPIVFARFADNSKNEHVARQPIVAGALLEVNAVYSELRTNHLLLSTMSDVDRLIEEKEFVRERMSQIYDPALTVYSAPAHLLSMILRSKDMALTYQYASAVANIALNLQKEHFERLKPPDAMLAWQNLLPGFRSSRDPGFAYTAICQSASRWVQEQSMSEWLDEALEKMGLDTAAAILEGARQRMKSDIVPPGDELLGRAERYLLSLGVDVLVLRSKGDTALTPDRIFRDRLPVPPMFDQNGSTIDLSNGAFDRTQFPIEELHQRAASLHTWTMNFVDACR